MGKNKISSISSESLVSNKPKPSSFKLQLNLLLKKQYLVFTRNIKSTLFQILTPVFICIFLVCLQQLADYSMSTQVEKNPDVLTVNKIPKCYGKDCITVGIGLTTENQTDFLKFAMNYMANKNDLKKGKDIKIIATNYKDTIKYLHHNTNKTQTCVLFCTGDFMPPKNPYYNGTVPCRVPLNNTDFSFYSILINSTITPMLFFSGFNSPEPVDYASLAVKKNLDEALMYYTLGESVSLSIEVQSYPRPTNRYMSGYDVVSDSGAFYFFIPPMVTFVVLLIEIVREKEYRLRFGLLLMGMRQDVYWFSWFLTGVLFILIVTNSLIISGLACMFQVFLNTPYPFFLVLFVLFGVAMMHLAFCVSALLKTTKAAYTSSYGFILVGLVLQFLLSDITIIYILYAEDVPRWVVIVRNLLPLYPPFNFAKAYGDISNKASSHYSSKEKRWTDGDLYTWNDFTSVIHAKISGNAVKVPSTLTSFMILVADLVLYAVLAWYLDHVISSNRGSPDSLLFFCSPKYWGCKKKKSVKTAYNNTLTPVRPNPTFLSNCKIDASFMSLNTLIDLKNLNKIFTQRKCFKSSSLHAVKDFSLSISQKELLVILGHNGAGKSTLINIITGLTSISSGSGEIFGYDIRDEIDEIRKLLGICPQHDILWNELTAKEHLVLFSRLKGKTLEEAEKEAESILKKVKLDHVGDKQVGTFSGGMKRRLSVGISGVGDPQLIIMDEPTTGMDPINRRFAWKLIQGLRKDRMVLLTTHSMEEADVLSDRVCVVVDGSLKCIGTSLYLKNTFGDGFRITLICEDVGKVLRVLKEVFTGCRVLDVSASNVLVGLQTSVREEVERFFQGMEKESELSGLVREWGFSNTTLEEVFMRVTGKKIARIDEEVY